MSKRKNNNIQDPTKDRIVTVRFSYEEYDELSSLAKESGKSVSVVIRYACLNKKLYYRLTDKEAEALCSLTDARGDLVNIQNALRSTSEDVKLKLFNSFKFMQRWIDAINQIVDQWDNIIERLAQ